MDIPNGLLSHIPCPNGVGCKTVKCLFGHPPADPEATSTASTSTPNISASTGKHRPSFSDDDNSAEKRHKIAHIQNNPGDDRPTPTIHSRSPSSTWSQRASQGSSESSVNSLFSASSGASSKGDSSQLSALKRPISPPPLRRQREGPTPTKPTNSVSTAGSAQMPASTVTPGTAPISVTASGKDAPPSNSTASNKPLPPPQEKRKPETLNPRYVAKAPAKHEIRLRLVKLLHQEFTRLNKLLHASKEHPEDRKHYLLTPQGLIWAALDLEEHYATTKSSAIYSDTIKHRIMEFKRMTIAQWVKERKGAKEAARRARLEIAAATATTATTTKALTVSKPTNTKTLAVATTASKAPPPPIVTGLPPDQEVVLLQKHFITPTDKLGNHGYVPTIPADADIKKARDAEEVSKGWEQCERCTRRFQVFPGRREEDGALTSGGKCQYHPGRLNHATQVFGCCSASASDGSPGCETAPSHVFKANDAKRLASLWNFVETPSNPDPNVPVDRAVCFDCEMAYTVYGVEVVRLTATSWPSGDLLLDILVRPHGTVIDFNSRFSGVFPEDFAMSIPYTPEAVETAKKNKPTALSKGKDGKSASRPPMLMASSPKEARDLFHKLIRPETVLIGHALENDLKAMRMIHSRISDTVLLFPHPKGLPIRYSLRVLAKEHLDRVVQAGGPLAGHDSAEDARVAGDLVRVKIKAKWDDLRRRQNWKLVDGVMVQEM